MAKTVVKQVIITLLLCLAILLILAVLLYAYVPNNKVIPEKVSYTAPEDVKEVLDETVSEDSQVILTYEVNSSDLTNAERINDYNPGKVNPFSSYEITEGTTESDSTGATSDNANSGTSATGNANSSDSGTSNSETSDSSEGTFFDDRSTK